MFDQEQQQANNAPGVLIDNNTGEVSEPHPLSLGGSNDEGADSQDGVDTGNQSEEIANGDGTGDNGDESSGAASDSGDSQDGGNAAASSVTQPNPQAQTPQAQATRLEDPGEFTPNKDGQYSFDVTLADGTKYRVEKPEDIDQLPPSPEFATVQDHAKFNAAYTRMVTGLDADKRDWERQNADYSKQEEQNQAFEQEFTFLTNGLAYLEKEGALPAVPAQYENADWRDPEVAKQPGVKERVNLVNFMVAENNKRAAAGLPKMSILDAHEKMENNALKDQMAKRTQKQNEMRKQRGAMVGGTSAPTPGNRVGNDMIVGSGGTLRDL